MNAVSWKKKPFKPFLRKLTSRRPVNKAVAFVQATFIYIPLAFLIYPAKKYKYKINRGILRNDVKLVKDLAVVRPRPIRTGEKFFPKMSYSDALKY
jgi:hypothetical protein